MITKSQIKSILYDFINGGGGTSRYAIYPFGENGMNVKEVLDQCFSVSSYVIVDNMLSKVNANILAADELYRILDDTFIVIFTAEEPWLHSKLLRELYKHIDKNQIIDIPYVFNSKRLIWRNYNQFEISQVFPVNESLNKNHNTADKITKVRIYNFTDNCWNTLMSVAEYFQKDQRFDLIVLARESNNSSLVYNYLEKRGIKQSYIEYYDPSEDEPDIFFLCHSCDFFTQINSLHQYCELVIVASMDLLRYSHHWNGFWNMYNSAFARFEPDYFLFDSLLYNDILQSGFQTDRIVEMGNAKFDGIYWENINFSFPPKWTKLKGMRKIILYATDHGVHDIDITEDISLDMYGRCIFEYAEKNRDIGFIFRPHPTLISEMKKTGIWSEKGIISLREYFDSTSNVVLDTSMNYNSALVAADAIITDAYCGITCEALPLNKPILMIYRDSNSKPYHLEIEDCNYSAYNQKQIIDFLEMVIRGDDKKYEIRKKTIPQIIKYFDGKNGERIARFAINKLEEKRRITI